MKNTLLISVVITLLVPSKIVAKFIPGIGCGTLKTIQLINRDPTPEEEDAGCLYITKDVSSFAPVEPGPEGTVWIWWMSHSKWSNGPNEPHGPGQTIRHITVLVLRMAHRIWKETKQEPGATGTDNMLGCCLCLISFHFLWAILSTSTVLHFWCNIHPNHNLPGYY